MNRRSFLFLPLAARAASGTLYRQLLRSLESIETFDTHEHILAESDRVKLPVDFFTLGSHYANNDMISAGLPPADAEMMGSDQVSAAQKWKAYEPWWRFARMTAYGEALRIAIRDIYGFGEITASTLPRISEAIAARNRPGLYREVLKQRAKIRFGVNDEYWQSKPTAVDPEFFVLARKFDWFLSPVTREGVGRLEKLAGVSIASAADLKRALERHFELSLQLGMVTVKSTIAYQRDLRFEEVSGEEAERDFERLMRGEERIPEGFRALSSRPYRKLTNHMFHHMVSLAAAHGVPVQIHTGLHAGNGNFVTNSRPSDLTNLFFLFPSVQFDLFHIGYPWQGECAVLAKTFPNVHADFCWMHIVSPTAARSALHEMLDMVPPNKIFGFGGDYRYPELSYAHLVMARRNIATVLAERVESRRCSETEAVELGRWLMLDNAARLFSPRNAARAPESK